MHASHREVGPEVNRLPPWSYTEGTGMCRQTLSSRDLAWLPPLWPYQVAATNPPPASWVTLAEVSDFVLSFPWVWNWKCVPRLPSTPATSPVCLSLWL